MNPKVIRGGVDAGSPAEAHGIAPEAVVRLWPLWKTRKRACFVCETVYLSAGYAWRCERWHWGD